MQLRTRLRAGVYWDEQNRERACAILELVTGDGQVRRLTVIDGETGQPVLDPVEAIPVESDGTAP